MEFGSMIFNDAVMRQRLPHKAYESLKRTIEEGLPLDVSLANITAEAMKDWAMEHGATHYSHWFIPMTGSTAEKHDAFLSRDSEGDVIYKLSGDNLVKGESDASSFPSGGLRATFEARGYTTWDCTSPAFIKGSTLCIPTVFCSYTGEALDEKLPLLRSLEVLNSAAIRLYNLIGLNVKRVNVHVGVEQEYFLIDKDMYRKRPDLIYTKRTLIGRMPPKGQELSDHYFGNIKPRVRAFMKELDAELWKLGVPAKTEHNEVAPSQHELAQLFTVANIAADSNLLTMEIMHNIADKHNFVCLLHEKPFRGVNGSGKHNNWSLGTDAGIHLLDPGKEPENNLPFLITLAAVIRGVDKYGDLLRMVAATASNDHRLGAHEAPPAVLSVYLGDELTRILFGEEAKQEAVFKLNNSINTLPDFIRDNADRNRTSPLAFTINKFELRILGSSGSVALANTIFNTAVADSLNHFADKLENKPDLQSAALKVLRDEMKDHIRIVFNGDNYAAEWLEEAKKRGLPNIPDSVSAVSVLMEEKNVKLLTSLGIYTINELESRYSVMYEKYSKIINIEACALIEIVNTMVIPAVNRQTLEYASTLTKLNKMGNINTEYLDKIIVSITELSNKLCATLHTLETEVKSAATIEDDKSRAVFYRDKVFPAMEQVRNTTDALEGITDKNIWPLPGYGDLLFYV